MLKRDESIVILPADKGRATVVMDRTAYTAKAQALLSDKKAYHRLQTDPLPAMKRRARTTIAQLKREGKLTDRIADRIRPSDAATARFYGLPKIHKDDIPLRPIVALRGSPFYGLADWLSEQLKHLVAGSTTNSSCSTDFLERIRGMTVDGDETLVSFDVTSLFTAIPQALAIDTLRELLTQKGCQGSLERLTLDEVTELLRFSLRTVFTFDGQVYEQIQGTPMGSPISGVIAEAVLQKLDETGID